MKEALDFFGRIEKLKKEFFGNLKSLKSKIYKKFISLQFLIKLYRFRTFRLPIKEIEDPLEVWLLGWLLTLEDAPSTMVLGKLLTATFSGETLSERVFV